MRTCSVDGCDRRVHARDWCALHYRANWVRFAVPAGMTAAEIQQVSDLADAGCARVIYILHPNFRLPEDVKIRGNR